MFVEQTVIHPKNRYEHLSKTHPYRITNKADRLPGSCTWTPHCWLKVDTASGRSSRFPRSVCIQPLTLTECCISCSCYAGFIAPTTCLVGATWQTACLAGCIQYTTRWTVKVQQQAGTPLPINCLPVTYCMWRRANHLLHLIKPPYWSPSLDFKPPCGCARCYCNGRTF